MDFPVDTLRAERIVLQGKDISLNLKGANMQTKTSLPAATLDWFEKMIFVVGDRSYICTSNTETPATDEQVFWVEV